MRFITTSIHYHLWLNIRMEKNHFTEPLWTSTSLSLTRMRARYQDTTSYTVSILTIVLYERLNDLISSFIWILSEELTSWKRIWWTKSPLPLKRTLGCRLLQTKSILTILLPTILLLIMKKLWNKSSSLLTEQYEYFLAWQGRNMRYIVFFEVVINMEKTQSKKKKIIVKKLK